MLSAIVGVAIVGVLIAIIAIHAGGSADNSSDRTAAPASVVDTITGVTPATLTSVAGGSATASARPANSGDPVLTANGKPQVLFIGGEFCPHCAAERWALLQAFSRFGKFKGISEIHSAANDGNIATLSFYKSSYSSKYVTFTPIEAEDRAQNKLESLTDAQQKLFAEYSNSFPFIDFGGKYVQTGAGYAYTDLSGKTQAQIAAEVKDPTSKIAQDILGESNNLTATICKITNNTPANVCSAPQITTIEGQLGA